jgi:hypothetical protein
MMLAAAVLVVAAVALTSTVTGAATDAATHHLNQRGAPHGATKASNLIDHGGSVLSISHVYVIWWGTSSAWASDVQSGMATFFGGLNGSAYANTASQYMRQHPLSITLSGTKADPSNPPKRVNAGTLGAEVAKEFTTVDSSGIYFVFTSNFPSGGSYCAWHSATSVNGTPIAVAYMPNSTNIAGCNPQNLYGLSCSEGLRSLANFSAHEFMEAITNPLISAWYDSSGSEIGDKCAWKFSSPVSLSGSTWQLQEEWSNTVSSCVQAS